MRYLYCRASVAVILTDMMNCKVYAVAELCIFVNLILNYIVAYSSSSSFIERTQYSSCRQTVLSICSAGQKG